MLLLSLLGQFKFGQYWRWIGLFGMLTIELTVILYHESKIGYILQLFMPELTIREQMMMLHQIYLSLCIAVNYLGPFWLEKTEAMTLDRELQRSVLITNTLTFMSAHLLKQIMDALENDDEELLEKLRQEIQKQYMARYRLKDETYANIYQSLKST
jgi:hypothetical protein